MAPTILRDCEARKGRVAPFYLYRATTGSRGSPSDLALSLRRLLGPLLPALLDAARELLPVFIERFGQLIAVAVHRPGRPQLHKGEQLVHLLFPAGDRGRAAVALHNGFVRLARRN